MVLAAKSCFDSLESVDRGRDERPYYSSRGEAMGTSCRLVFSAPSRATADEFRQMFADWLHEFEKRYSRFRESSLISRINASAGIHAVDIDRELSSILALCDWFHWVSRGIFDPTMLPLERLWDYHVDTPSVPSSDAVEKAKSLVGWKHVQRSEMSVFLPIKGMALDIGGIGKEYAVDRVFEMAEDAGLTDVMVDFGHDVRVLGHPPEGGGWRIGLEDPRCPGRCWTGVGLSSMAIATSGNYARGFEWQGKRYGHILDPRTGYPVDNGSLSTSVVAPTCTEAGILSTAAFIFGADEFADLLRANSQVQGCMMTASEELRTPGFARYELKKSSRKQG